MSLYLVLTFGGCDSLRFNFNMTMDMIMNNPSNGPGWKIHLNG